LHEELATLSAKGGSKPIAAATWDPHQAPLPTLSLTPGLFLHSPCSRCWSREVSWLCVLW